jgi:glycine betaine/proline transport system permease protein
MPKIPIGNAADSFINFLKEDLSWVFNGISWVLDNAISGLEGFLDSIPPIALIFLLCFIILLVTTKGITIWSFLGLLLVYDLDLWSELIKILVLVLVAVILALIISIPTGIWMTRSKTVERIAFPILDFMQTMPSFVYLVPAAMLFGIGAVPGLLATLVFAIPPPVRLTYLGITQVPGDLKEAARAFGASDRQVLTKVELPLSLPSIMAGVNQCIMLGISMVVIASMIGAPGLGRVVLTAVNRLDMAMGFEGGLAIVILAMILDRFSRNMGEYEKIFERFGKIKQKLKGVIH